MHRIISIGFTLLLFNIYLKCIIVDAIKQNKYTFMSSKTATGHKFHRRKRALLPEETVHDIAVTDSDSALVDKICTSPEDSCKHVVVNITHIVSNSSQ
jgi:hypothetical protein